MSREVRIGLGDRLAQRGVQRVDRAVALGRADVALAVDPDLDGGLGLDLAVLALLGHHAPRLELEERLVLAGLAADQQVEGAVGRLELEALVLELLDALDHPRRGRVVEREAGLLGAREHGPAAGELGDQHLARVADRGGVDVLERRGVGVDAGDVQPALVREGVLAHVGLVGVGDEVEELVEQVRGLGQPGQRGQAVVPHLELEVGDDRDEVGVAAALAVAVHRALDHRRPGAHARERVGDADARVVVAVDADRAGRASATTAAVAASMPSGSVAPLVSHSVT